MNEGQANQILNRIFYGTGTATPVKAKEAAKPLSIDDYEKLLAQRAKRKMREVQWDKWTSNYSGSHSEVHVTADGETTLCSKKIPQVGELPNLHHAKSRKEILRSGNTSSATGWTVYQTFVDYSSTTKGLYEPGSHDQNGTCACCVKRSNGKFINNHRTHTDRSARWQNGGESE